MRFAWFVMRIAACLRSICWQFQILPVAFDKLKAMALSQPFNPARNPLLTFCLVGGIFLAAAQTLCAIPITGDIQFTGTAKLDSSTTLTSTKVLTWGNDGTVDFACGSFSGLAGSQVSLDPWLFYSGAHNGLWSVGDFTYNLSLSAEYANMPDSLIVVLMGTVISANLDLEPTVFNSTLTIHAPDANGMCYYRQNISFNSVPDTGATLLLMGIAAVMLGVVKYKWDT